MDFESTDIVKIRTKEKEKKPRSLWNDRAQKHREKLHDVDSKQMKD